MKTGLGLFLGALLALSLAACDGGGDGTGATGGAGGSAGGSGGTGGGMGGTGGGTGGSTPAPSCDSYCANIQANCKDANAQYGSNDQCMAVCASFPIGTAADMAGNSVGCRTYHGGDPAADDAGTHCPHAGPLGDGVCGDDCDSFCTIAIAICGGEAAPPYASKDECMTACAGFKGTDEVPYNTAATAGDSLACRMYHLTVATGDKATHCPHIAAVSTTCN